MKLVMDQQKFNSNGMYRVDIVVDTAVLNTNLAPVNTFVMSARDEESAQHEANMWFAELVGLDSPKTIGDMIAMTMDFKKWALKDFESKNGINSKNPTEIDNSITLKAPERITYGEAMRLVRTGDGRKNFLSSLMEDAENYSKVV